MLGIGFFLVGVTGVRAAAEVIVMEFGRQVKQTGVGGWGSEVSWSTGGIGVLGYMDGVYRLIEYSIKAGWLLNSGHIACA